MPPPRNIEIGLMKLAALSLFLVFLMILLPPPPKPVAVRLMSSTSKYRPDQKEQLRQELILGSRPPGCVNKCMSCHPCDPALVIPPPHYRKSTVFRESVYGDTYYLLSWKCRCGDKLFQP